MSDLLDSISLVDGVASTTISIRDRGLAYGDGLFETIAIVNGKPRHWSDHMARLEQGCHSLGIVFPDPMMWRDDLNIAYSALRAPNYAVLKLMLTRGSGPRGYAPITASSPTRIILLSQWPEHQRQMTPLRVLECRTQLGLNPALAGIKHLNRLEQVLAAREVQTAGMDEGLMRDRTGYVIAGTRSNLFIVRGNSLLTPRLDDAGIHGIMRRLVIEQVRLIGMTSCEAALTLHEVISADELWMTNALIGIRPVASLQSSLGQFTYSIEKGIHAQAIFQAASLAP